MESKTTKVLKGIPVSPGIVIGEVFLLETDDEFMVEKFEISPDAVREEVSRYKAALAKTRQDMLQIKEKLLKTLGKSHERLAEAYQMILEDPLLTKDVVKRISQDRINAAYALYEVIDKTVKALDLVSDEYFRDRRHDIMDVGRKIMRYIMGQEHKTLSGINKPSLIVARNLTLADTIHLKEHMALGFATDIGGRTSHAALLAQSLEIPAVVGLRDITRQVRNKDILLLDGNEGTIIISPGEDTIQNYQRLKETRLAQLQAIEKFKHLPAQTVDGRKVNVMANIDSHDEVKSALDHGGEGIGLYRTEAMYLNRTTAPTEEELFESYRSCGMSAFPYPVVIRTVDIGGDKLASMGVTATVSESNPFLGLRGIRLCLKFPELFRTQLRAILRASANSNLKLMYPMISGIEELRCANGMLAEIKENLKKENVPFNENIEVGVMIEVPSAAIVVDIIAREVDFLSIGTNDLIQYTLAVDRINENVAQLYEPVHLAILRLIKQTIAGGHAAGKKVSICGEMASESGLVPVLIGFGLDELSVTPPSIPIIKQAVREANYAECQRLVEAVQTQTDIEGIHDLIKRASLS